MPGGGRAATSKTLAVIAVVAALAVGAGLLVSNSGGSQSGSNTVNLKIYESDPVAQADSFDPTNITVAHGVTFTLAVQNGDDQPRTFEISALNVNQTIGAGTVVRITLTAGQTGVYRMFVPATTAASALNGHASPSITGYIVVG